jgi:hypothetical protein
MPTGIINFDESVGAFYGLIIVIVVGVIATWFARLHYVRHRNAEFSELSPEQIERRKSLYESVRALSVVAFLIAVLLLCQTCS